VKTVYVMGAGASAAEGAPVVRNFLRIAHRYFKEERNDIDLEVVWEFLEYFYGTRKKSNLKMTSTNTWGLMSYSILSTGIFFTTRLFR